MQINLAVGKDGTIFYILVPLSIWAQREDGVCIFLLRTDALQKMVQASFSAPSDKMLIYDGHGELILSSGSKDYEYFSNEGNLFFDSANLERSYMAIQNMFAVKPRPVGDIPISG